MNAYDSQIEKLTRILQHAEFLTHSGFLTDQTIKVAFEENDEVFNVDFKFTNKKDYIRFNKHLRRMQQG